MPCSRRDTTASTSVRSVISGSAPSSSRPSARAGCCSCSPAAYVEIDVSSDEAPAKGFGELDQVCDQFDATSQGVESSFLPRPTVALIAPGREGQDARDAAWWDRIERVLGELVERCERRGYDACLHNEVGTEIASQESIFRALTAAPVSLCLDTGHLVAAGGDPLAVLEAWPERVRHIHLKGARVEAGAHAYEDAMELWENSVFCKLGAGAGRVDEVLAELRERKYAGWIVVEQDVLPRGKQAYDTARADQVENRRYLAERGW